MTTDPFDTEMLERYLRTRRLRYFRGHHDGEFFFILTSPRERLHVHLEIPDVKSSVVTVSVTPSYFFPAVHRERLQQFVASWNRDNPRAQALVHDSCDLTRIGVVVKNSCPVDDSVSFEDLESSLDQTIRSAMQFFSELAPVVEVPSTATPPTWVRDAG